MFREKLQVRHRSRRYDLALLGALSLACAPRVGEVVNDCILPVPSGFMALSAPVSVEYSDRSLWLWEDLWLEGGGIASFPSAFVSDVDHVCDSGPTLTASDAGELLPMFALTEAELEENLAHNDDRRLSLSPTGGFVHEDIGYLFYDHVIRGPGFFDEERLGTGICVLAPGATQCDRVGGPDGTILFAPTERVLNRGGITMGDRAYVYGCRPVASFQEVCTVTGAPVDRLTDPTAYRVHNDFDGWVDDLTRAASIVDDIGQISVSPYGAGVLMTVLDLFDATVHLRTAPAPVGPFSARADAFAAYASDTFFTGGGREHTGLRGASNTLHLSYSTDNALAPGLHLVSFEIDPGFGP
jgi:hypothetical protein